MASVRSRQDMFELSWGAYTAQVIITYHRRSWWWRVESWGRTDRRIGPYETRDACIEDARKQIIGHPLSLI